MKRLFLVTLVLLCASSSAFAQSGTVCLFSDSLGTACSFVDNGPGVLKIYVVHKYTTGATAVQFAAPMPACMAGASWLSDIGVWPVTIGSSQTGVSVGYGTCLQGPVHVMTMQFLVTGSTLPDCAYPVLADPRQEHVMISDCSNRALIASGGTSYINSGLPCECEDVPTPAVLKVTPAILTFFYSDSVKTLQITNTSIGTLNWNASTDQPWMTVDTPAGAGDATIHVAVDRTGLLNGSYSGAVHITSNGGDVTVPVTMIVSQTLLGLYPTVVDLGTTSTSGTFLIRNDGSGTLTWDISESIPWLSVSPLSGSGSQTITVNADRTGLASGLHTGLIDVQSNGGNGTVEVRLTVPSPTLSFFPSSFFFSVGVTGGTLSIANAGAGNLDWSITSSQPWLSAAPSAGTNSAVVQVSVDRTGLSSGSHSAVLSIASNGGNANVPVTVVVEGPNLHFYPTSFLFAPDVDSLGLSIENLGSQPLTWSITSDQAWLSADPSSGTDNTDVWVRVDRTGLPDSTFLGNLFITSNGGNGVIPVIMNSASQPILGVTPTSLMFSDAVTSRSFNITNQGIGTLTWSITDDSNWINVVPPLTGTGDHAVTVTVNPTLVPPATPDGHVTVTSNGGNATVAVHFQRVTGVGGTIGIYSDVEGNNCGIHDLTDLGILTVYVVHKTPGGTAAEFSAPMPACMTGATFLRDTSPMSVVLGNSQSGVSVGYGACYSGAVLVLSIEYLTQGTIQPCCPYPVLPRPNSPLGQVSVADCASPVPNTLVATGLNAIVNPDVTCPCDQALAVHETTWGRVKALYSDDALQPRNE
jgi:hypothetical protein